MGAERGTSIPYKEGNSLLCHPDGSTSHKERSVQGTGYLESVSSHRILTGEKEFVIQPVKKISFSLVEAFRWKDVSSIER